MPRQIGPIVETLMRRVRQEGGLAVDPDFATTIYSYCEQITNAYTHRVISSTTLSVPRQKLLFNYRIEIPDAIDIVSIRDASTGRRIDPFDNLSAIAAYDIDWFRKIDGTRFDAWCQLSRDILILYPGQAAASTVSVEYSKLLTLHTDFTTSYNTDSELPSEDIEFALKLSEIVLLTRFRQLIEATNAINAFINTYQQLGGKE